MIKTKKRTTKSCRSIIRSTYQDGSPKVIQTRLNNPHIEDRPQSEIVILRGDDGGNEYLVATLRRPFWESWKKKKLTSVWFRAPPFETILLNPKHLNQSIEVAFPKMIYDEKPSCKPEPKNKFKYGMI